MANATSNITRPTIKSWGFVLMVLFFIGVYGIYRNKFMEEPQVRQPPYRILNRTFKGEGACDAKRNFMFVKVHKAGSTTATCIFQRFGYEHNLTFVLSVIKSDVGWPNLLRQEDFIPSADGTYNVLVDHTVYNRQLLDHLMPTDTVYISILRQPLAQLRSVFNWYGLAKKIKGLGRSDPVASFIKSPNQFHVPYVKALSHTRQPYTLEKNFMAYDLGFPLGLSDSQSSIDEFVETLSREIDLVLILEHMDESLVLLRRRMCWALKDILYNVEPKNLRSYKKTPMSTALLNQHRRWSNVDYQLYDHFNATLWQKIGKEGADFLHEVHHFRNVLNQTTIFCTKAMVKVPAFDEKHKNVVRSTFALNGKASKLTIPKTAWHEEFDIDPALCLKLKMEWVDWEHVLKKKHKMPQNISSGITRAIEYPSTKVLDKSLLLKIFDVD
ncbi:galactose-3-O-sulfotransferase 2-like isoform X1 [Branchiostoma floridae]|uniref:Galactose-3-O-sulfotransferase 2-like isoform X1 n=1 Tax=Branchiostoma floridae TaxID=7739 RepID=A0A9J7HHD6_BRAFL|nr:galactose-3-O-sulfotransferase 2-like isoform X1 [Branchiostoma floridae]